MDVAPRPSAFAAIFAISFRLIVPSRFVISEALTKL